MSPFPTTKFSNRQLIEYIVCITIGLIQVLVVDVLGSIYNMTFLTGGCSQYGLAHTPCLKPSPLKASELITMNTRAYVSPTYEDSLLDKPALLPPHDVQPDFVNPSNRNGMVIGLAAACIVMLTLFSLLRGYSKLFCTKHVRVEDCEHMDLIPKFLLI